jgi:opacity protein-like surface antigen
LTTEKVIEGSQRFSHYDNSTQMHTNRQMCLGLFPHRRCRLVFWGTAVLLFLLLGPARTARAGQEEWLFNMIPQGSMIRANDHTYYGGGIGVALEYGLTDSWTARAAASYSGHAVLSPKAGLLSTARTGGHIIYMIDVLRVIPYLQAGLNVALIGGRGVRWGAYLGIEAGAGVDYMLSRKWSLGVEVGYNVFYPDTKKFPALLNLGFRISRRWY